MIEYLQLKRWQTLQCVAIYYGVLQCAIHQGFLRCIVLYHGGKYCGMSIYCNLASSLVFNRVASCLGGNTNIKDSDDVRLSVAH